MCCGGALLLTAAACATPKTGNPPEAERTEERTPVAENPSPPPKTESAAKKHEDGVYFEEHQTSEGRFWVYTPAPEITEPIGCVLIAPAGSNLLTGMLLGEGDRPEHLPYVRAGFMVVAFDIAGGVGPDATDNELGAAILEFRSAGAGVDSARSALTFATEHYPTIDPSRVYIAGHSSAATLALLAGAQEERIRAVVAYAPAVDVPAFLGAEVVGQLDAGMPGYAGFLRDSSPINHIDALAGKPVFLFHAKDDDVVAASESARLFPAGKSRDPKSRRLVVEEGGHYDAMLKDGIPAGIEWLKSL